MSGISWDSSKGVLIISFEDNYITVYHQQKALLNENGLTMIIV
jgi:hypothetical protein